MKKIAFYLLMISLLYSCHKDDGVPTEAINADLKTAFDYQPGTYWIYRDSLTGEIDSFAVKYNTSSTNTTAGGLVIDQIYIYIFEYPEGSSSYTSDWTMGLTTNNFSLQWFNDTGAYFVLSPALVYPFSADSVNLVTTFYNLTVNGNGYLNVGETYNNSVNSANNTYYYKVWLYINADQGIIKMDINVYADNIHKIWELVRCNIVK